MTHNWSDSNGTIWLARSSVSFMYDVMCKNPYRMYIRSTQVFSLHAEGNYHNIHKQGSPQFDDLSTSIFKDFFCTFTDSLMDLHQNNNNSIASIFGCITTKPPFSRSHNGISKYLENNIDLFKSMCLWVYFCSIINRNFSQSEQKRGNEPSFAQQRHRFYKTICTK